MSTVLFGQNNKVFVQVDGLDRLMAGLKRVDPEVHKMLKSRMREAAQPVLIKAQSNAAKIARTGSYRASLRLRGTGNGKVYLASNDEAAKVIEFAKHGARYTPKPTDKRINARKMSSFPVGVPKGDPPRVMVPAVNDSAQQVANRLDQLVEQILKRNVENG